jgi:tetratricopeptide (TPR) repeat protein
MYIRPATRRRKTSPWKWLAPIAVIGGLAILATRTDRDDRFLASLLPTATASPTGTPSAADIAAHARNSEVSGAGSAALEAWDEVLAMAPDDVEALAASAVLLSLRRRHEEALERANRAVDLAPDDARSYTALAVALDWGGRPADAVDAALSAQNRDADYVPALVALAEAYAESGRWDTAEDLADQAIDLAPGEAGPRRALGLVREIQGDSLGALAAYRAAADRAPSQPRYLIDLARVHRFRGETDAAATALEQARLLDERDPVVFDAMGLVDMDEGDLEAAAARFKQAVDVDPRYAPGYGHLGWIYYSRREWAPAAEAFRRAIDEGATSVEYLYELGLSLVYQGDCAAGAPWLQKALEKDPSLEAARQGLESCASPPGN